MLTPRVPSGFFPEKQRFTTRRPSIPHAASLRQPFGHCAIFPTAATRRCLDRVSVPVWPTNLSVRLPVLGLVSRYLTNNLIGRRPLSGRHGFPNPLVIRPGDWITPLGISQGFPRLSPSRRQVVYVLLTRAPLYSTNRSRCFSLDLHVLGTPPTFALSQDQTLQSNFRLTGG